MKPFSLELDFARAKVCSDELIAVCQRLGSLVSLEPLLSRITPEAIISLCITAAPPSPCVCRVEALLAGGFAGLRAFLHLAVEASGLAEAGFDPMRTDSPLESLVASRVQGRERSNEAALLRHQALFSYRASEGIGPTLWARSHTTALVLELELVEQLVKALGAPVDRGVIFWSDPGLNAQQRDDNADIMQRQGLTLVPHSAAPTDGFRDAYRRLLERASGLPSSAPSSPAISWP